MAFISKFTQFFKLEKLLRVDVCVDRENTYVPGDVISGSVNIVALRSIVIADGRISLKGRIFVEIQRAGVGSAQGVTISSEEQIFLKAEQQISSSRYITKGDSISLQFKLQIPLYVDWVCNHHIEDCVLREDHHSLPPCLDLRGPETGKIQYCLEFSGQIETLHNASTAQAVARQSIIVIPTRTSRPMSCHKGPLTIESSEETMFGILSNDLKSSNIQVFAHQPPAIIFDIRKSDTLTSGATAVSLILKVTSKSGSVLPQLKSIKRSFTSQTFLSTVPWKGFPMKYPGLSFNTNRGVRRERFKLSKLKLASMDWQRVIEDSENPVDEAQSVHICHLSIPIVPPAGMDVIPTFYSCLIAREYAVKLSLSFISRTAKRSSISLNVPVDIKCVDGKAED